MTDKGTRVQLQLNGPAMTRLHLIEALTGANSYADVVRNALEILEWHILENINGTDVLTKDRNGNVTTVKLFLDVSRTDVDKVREEIAAKQRKDDDHSVLSSPAVDDPEDAESRFLQTLIIDVPGLTNRQINSCISVGLRTVGDLGDYDVNTLSRLWGISRKSASDMIEKLDAEKGRMSSEKQPAYSIGDQE